MPTDKASDWGDKRRRCAISTPAHWLTRPWCDYACLHCRRQGLDDNSRTTATCALRCWAEESKKNPNCACFLLTSRTEALRTHFDSTTWPRCGIFYKLLKIEALPISLLVHGEIYLTEYFAGPPKKLFSICTACESAVSTKLDCSVCSIYILGLYQLLHSSSPPAHIQQQQQVFINGNRRGREIEIIETGWYLVIISYRKLYFCSLEYFDYGELSLDQVRFKSSWLEEFKLKVDQVDRVVCQIGSWRKIKPQTCLLVPVNWPPYCVQKLLLRERDSI